MSEPFVVALPAAIRPLLEAEAREHGFASVADYIAALVRANAPVEEEDPELESALLDGLASGSSREVDGTFWRDVRDRAAGTPRPDDVD